MPRQKHDQHTLLQPSLHRATFSQHTKLTPGVLIQINRLGNPHCCSLLERISMPVAINFTNSRALH